MSEKVERPMIGARVNPALKRRFERLAKMNRRSVSEEAALALEEHVNRAQQARERAKP